MAVKVKTWVWVVVAIVVIGVLGIVAMAGVGFYFFSQHVETQVVSPATASTEFDRVRAQFTGQRALIELDARGRFLRSNPERNPKPGVKVPDQLYVLAFDPD